METTTIEITTVTTATAIKITICITTVFRAPNGTHCRAAIDPVMQDIYLPGKSDKHTDRAYTYICNDVYLGGKTPPPPFKVWSQ
jgi:hypothetical protein